MRRRRRLFLSVLAALTAILVGTTTLSVLVGDLPLAPGQVAAVLRAHFGGKPVADAVADAVVWQVRIPRALAAAGAGAALACCGAVFQGLLLNPLAEPYTMGVAAGAALGGALAILMGLPIVALAFAGSLLSLALVWLLGRRTDFIEPTRLILAGVIVSSILSAGITLIQVLAGQQVAAIVLWLLGSFTRANWALAGRTLAASLAALLLGLACHRELDIIASGGKAASFGVNEERLRLFLLAGTSLVTAAVVSSCGIIGFVGLVVPHLIRLLLGPAHGPLLLLSWLGGASLMLGADLTARFLGELPIGVVTALLGGPVFCYLLWRR